VEEYSTIDWPSCRNKIAAVDLYTPHSKVADTLFSILSVYEKVAPSFIRNAALDEAYRLVVRLFFSFV
jgi:lanosterol synthase